MHKTSACNTSSVLQGDRIPLDFASVHQLVRNRTTDGAHVYSDAESKVLVLCTVSIESRRLAQAPQVLGSSASRDSAITVQNSRSVFVDLRS